MAGDDPGAGEVFPGNLNAGTGAPAFGNLKTGGAGFLPKFRFILGTVEGDLHDVGKNLVAIMFRSAGFQVIDLGVDVSEKQFLRAVKENPDVSIVCLSSLLTTSMGAMRQVVRALRETKDRQMLKIMVGGGSVTREFADEIGADAYSETAVEAAELAKTFLI